LGNISNGGARDFDPGLGEQGASTHHEDNVENGVEGVSEDREEISRGRNVVSETTDGDRVTAHFDILPLAEKSDGEEVSESSVEELREEIEVGDQSSVEHDGDVGSVEQLDGEVGGVTSNTLLLNVKINSETLEVNDDEEDEDGSEQVVQVGETLSVESLLEGSDLVGFGDQEVEEGDDGTFVLSTSFSDNGNGGEGSPEDVFADVGSNEREIPDPPKPHPLERTSSSIMTMTPAKVSWMMIKIALPAPIASMSPYWPDQTVAKASKRAINKPRSF